MVGRQESTTGPFTTTTASADDSADLVPSPTATLLITATNATPTVNVQTSTAAATGLQQSMINTTTTADSPKTTQGHDATNGDPQQHNINTRHTDGRLAGAIVGSFFAGAVLSALILFAIMVFWRRKERRLQRDQRIQNAFIANITEANESSQDIGLTSAQDKPPSVLHDHKLVQRRSWAAPPEPDHERKSLSDPLPFPRLSGKSSPLKEPEWGQPAGTLKRQSFPEALLVGRPRRHISISATGLISPVAASPPAKDHEALEQIINHLRLEANIFFEQVALHVDNFYEDGLSTNRDLSLTPREQEQLQRFDSPHLEDSIAGLLPAATNARALIKHCLTENIISRLDYVSRRRESEDMLLPAGMMSTYRLMAPLIPRTQSRVDEAPVLQRWRMQTTSLLRFESLQFAMSDQIQHCALGLTRAFQPWAISRYSTEARSSHLAKLIGEAMELGLEIFGMPNEAVWLWTADDQQIAVFPGLAIRTDDIGKSAATSNDGPGVIVVRLADLEKM